MNEHPARQSAGDTIAPPHSFELSPPTCLGTMELTDIGPYGKSAVITCASPQERLVFVPIVLGLQMRPNPGTEVSGSGYSLFFNQVDNVGTVTVTTPGHIDWIQLRVLAFSSR